MRLGSVYTFMLRPLLLSLLFWTAAHALVCAGETGAETIALVPDTFAPLDQYYKGKCAPEWVAALKTKDDPAQLKLALEAVAELCPLSSGASVAILELLIILKTSNDPALVRLAMVALGRMGPDARDAESVLMAVLDNVIEAPANRTVACRALIQIAPESAFVRRAVLAAANDRNVEVRREALVALVVLAMPASPYVPVLPPAPAGPVLPDIAAPSNDKSANGKPTEGKPAEVKPVGTRSAVPKFKPAVSTENGAFPFSPALEALAKAALSSRDAKEADAALRTLGEPGVDALLHALTAGSPLARAAAADTLGSMKRAGRRAFPALLQAARKETDRRARDAQIFGAANLSVRDPAVLDLLADSLGAKADPFAPFHWIAADDLLYGVGKDALPALRRALRSDNSASRLAALRILARFVAPTSENAEIPEEPENRAILKNDAPKPQSALPVLVGDCLADIAGRLQDKDDDVRLFALATLNRIGPAAAGALESIQRASAMDRRTELKVGQKTGKNADVAFQRLATIAALNVSRTIAVPVCLTPLDGLTAERLLVALATASPADRADAALALRLYNADAANAATLSKALDDPDPLVRYSAARALGYFGAGTEGALPSLIKWLELDPKSRRVAIETFASLGVKAADAAAPLARTAAEDAWPDDTEFPRTLVRALRPHAAVAVPALTGYIRSGSPEIRVRSAKVLGLLGPSAAESLPALMELAQSADDAEAQAAYDALRLIGPEKDPETIPFLSTVIRGELYASRRKWAVRALGQSRPALDAGVPERAGALAAALCDGDDSVCRAAYDALLEIGEPAIPIVIANVVADQSARNYWPLCVLAALKADAEVVMPRLIEFTLPGNPASRRVVAADLMGGYATAQPRHPGVVPALLRLLRTGDAPSAHAAMRALKPLAAEVRPAIERLLFDREPEVRKIAAEALDSF